jgi:plastocyanin
MNGKSMLIPAVGLALLLSVFSLGFVLRAALDDDDFDAGRWWGPMGMPMMGSQHGYTGDHMRWMMGGFEVGNAPLTQGSASQTIAMRNYAFSPNNVQVPVGATVTWRNDDDAPHVATASDGTWSTVLLKKGETSTVKFDKAGDFLYLCNLHPGMGGRLRIQ